MFKKILVANRGEIALRILCACKELGIRTVAVYSEADRYTLPVRFADEAVCIGPPRVTDSYLNIAQVISAAEITGADAIHPGYGFLAENANFAEVCEASGLTFIGPRSEHIRLMGEKSLARREMAKAGVPVLPGSVGVVPAEEEAARLASTIGYPVMIKAAAGGGGKGMRVVRKPEELAPLYRMARVEAEQAFGTSDVYLEKFIEQPRHIEFQVLADTQGEVLHLGERECSIQRRHQKLIEESPSVMVDEAVRQQVGGQVVRALRAIGYSNVGTVEFLTDASRNFYFIEMNTRIQVEHCVTEMVTGVDLIKAQIQLAGGTPLAAITRPNLRPRGHAIECRIVAEDPETFDPSSGRITVFQPPGGTGVRVDTAAYAEAVVPPYYDSLIAKVITHGRDREEALRRMTRALEMFIIEGIQTSIPVLRKIVADPDFQQGRYDTHFMTRFFSNHLG
ncbi:MAG: acetyl-CoA carboxylase biotin carboxylase subunit [Acidobacteria bacterium]|nr:acetyl-CoA carboxylase biotin carboxylase subunit [Acidobacteriota bacterium]